MHLPPFRHRRRPIRIATRTALPLAALLVASCATSPSTRAPETAAPAARIEIQEAVGFTITEEARIASDVEAAYLRALELLEQGQTGQGIAALQAVVETAPELTAPRVDLGIALHRAGRLDDAERQLGLALEASPDHPIAHNELGIVQRKGGQFAAARASYEAALAVYPGYHFARRNLAILCDLYLADPGCALENYEAYMATVPGDDEVSMWMKDLRYRMENGL